MRKRVGYGLSVSGTIVLLLVLDHLFAMPHCFCGLVALASVVGWLEYSAMTMPARKSFKYFGAVLVGACGVALWILACCLTPPVFETVRGILFLGAVFVFLLWRTLGWREDGPSELADCALWIAGFLYLALLPSFLFQLRCLDHGAGLILYVLLVVKVGDSGAYFTGKTLGRRKLCPVSPNKTIEGALGGLAASIGAGLLTAWLLFRDDPGFCLGYFALISATLAIVGQLGDLVESFLKRSCRIKDSAAIVPELGGVLDMADSLLFAAPVLYFFVG